MVSFIVDGSMYSIGLILPHIRVNYDVAQDKVNLVNGLFTGFLFCSGPIVSGLSTQFGIRPVVIGGAIVTSACMVATAFAPSIYFIMIVYGVIGGTKIISFLRFYLTTRFSKLKFILLEF